MMTEYDDQFLDDLFKEARTEKDAASDELMARVLADAEALQPKANERHIELVQPSVWRQFLDVLGGWPALGSVTAAGVVGLWLGLAPTATLDGLAADFLGETTSVSFIQDYDFLTEDTFDG